MDTSMKYRSRGPSTTSDDASSDKRPSASIHMNESNLTKEEIQESMACLKEKLDLLKNMVDSDGGPLLQPKKTPTFIDENILSAIFAVALAAILGATVYAFQGLYVAVSKKWSS